MWAQPAVMAATTPLSHKQPLGSTANRVGKKGMVWQLAWQFGWEGIPLRKGHPTGQEGGNKYTLTLHPDLHSPRALTLRDPQGRMVGKDCGTGCTIYSSGG